MARTKGKPTALTKDRFVRTIEYNGAHVAKMNGGAIFAVFNLDESDETRMPANDMKEAKHIIDSAESKSRVTDDPRKRSRRTKGVKMSADELFDGSDAHTLKRGRRTKGIKVVESKYCFCDPEKFGHLSHGGYRMNPPESCTKRVKFEGEKPWWVDNILCASSCKESEKCPHFVEFMKGSRKRIKLMSTERMNKECEWCKAPIDTVDEDGSGVFKCGTTYNRLEGQYTRICKPEKKKQDKPTVKKMRRTK